HIQNWKSGASQPPPLAVAVNLIFAPPGCGGARSEVKVALEHPGSVRMVPPRPASHACDASLKATARRWFSVGSVNAVHVAPFPVRSATPKLPTAMQLVAVEQLTP